MDAQAFWIFIDNIGLWGLILPALAYAATAFLLLEMPWIFKKQASKWKRDVLIAIPVGILIALLVGQLALVNYLLPKLLLLLTAIAFIILLIAAGIRTVKG